MARSTGDRPFYGSAVEILHTTLAGYRPKYHPSAHPYLISLDRFLVTCFAYVSSPCLRAKRRTGFVSIIDACITDNARLMLTTNVARSILTRPLKPDAFDVVHYFPLSMTPCFLPLVSCQTSSVSFLTYFFPSVRPILEQYWLVSRISRMAMSRTCSTDRVTSCFSNCSRDFHD